MAIAYQPVMAPERISTRPARPRRVLVRTVPVAVPTRAWTTARIAGLIAATALCVALATAIVVGSAFFALLNLAGA